MKIKIRLALFVGLCMLSFSLHTELLIIKKTDQGFAPLDASDEPNKNKLSNIILNYEWPMVTANTALTPEEQDELLTAGKPYAEEEFIRRKVKEVNPSYDVIFVPTALYELFIMSEWKQDSPSALDNAVGLSGHDIDLIPFLHISNELLSRVYAKIYETYRQTDRLFYPNAFFFINNRFVVKLFEFFNVLSTSNDAQMVSSGIKNQVNQLAAYLIYRSFPSAHEKVRSYAGYITKKQIDPQNAHTIIPHGVLANIIALEYEARMQNKGLLLRGTQPILLFSYKEHEKDHLATLIGSTLREKEAFGDISGNYKAKESKPYSIAFGNSSFAGMIYDSGACAYTHLVNEGGYGLFINKKDYVQHHSQNLFFIAPLSPLAALFSKGEFFHSRAKAAVKRGRYLNIAGIHGESFEDPLGIITTARDPLVHGELFSKYLVENMTIIGKRNAKALLPEEKKVYEEKFKQAQMQAAQYYKGIRTLERFATKASANFREKRASKNQSADTRAPKKPRVTEQAH